MAKHNHLLGLTACEWRLIRDAHHAHSLVPNGHFLPTPCKANVNAAKRMVERGFLTFVEGQLTPPHPDWIVLVMTEENRVAYNDAIAAATSEQAPVTEAGEDS